MPFHGSTIATVEAELWGITDSANSAATKWADLAAFGAQLGGPQDGVFGQLNDVQTELNASGGPRGWLPGLLVAILGLIFGSVVWISQGLDNWVQWAKTHATDGFADFIEGMRALIETAPQVATNAMIGAITYAQHLFASAQYQEQGDVGNIRVLINDVYQHELGDFGNLQNQISTTGQSLQNQEQADVGNLRVLINDVYVSLKTQEQADTGNLQHLIDQNFFTLQQQEHADTQNLQHEIDTQVQPQISALQGLLGLTILPELGALTQIATQTAQQLKQDEQQCIDPLCKNLGKTSNATGLLQDLGILAMVLAFIAECVHDPSGVSDFLVGTIAPNAIDTTRNATSA